MKKVFPKIKYASIGELSIAYQVWGEADNVLVYVPGIVSHLEVTLEINGYVKECRIVMLHCQSSKREPTI